jgi:hypothetical protein
MNEPDFNPAVFVTSIGADPDKQIVEEAKWLLDPPPISRQLQTLVEQSISNYIGTAVTHSLTDRIQSELLAKMTQLQLNSTIYKFVVENTTTPDEIERGEIKMRVSYLLRPFGDTAVIDIQAKP